MRKITNHIGRLTSELWCNCQECPDEPDDVSVISESFTSDSSVSEQDLDEEDLIPVSSDSELADKLLDQLENLNLQKVAFSSGYFS